MFNTKAKASVIFSTLPTAPPGYRIAEVFSAISAAKVFDPDNLMSGLVQNPNMVASKAMELLRKSLPQDANAVIGILFQQTNAPRKDGARLFTTVMGTPVRLEPCHDQQVSSSIPNAEQQPHGSGRPGIPGLQEPGGNEAQDAVENAEEGKGGSMPGGMSQPTVF